MRQRNFNTAYVKNPLNVFLLRMQSKNKSVSNKIVELNYFIFNIYAIYESSYYEQK